MALSCVWSAFRRSFAVCAELFLPSTFCTIVVSLLIPRSFGRLVVQVESDRIAREAHGRRDLRAGALYGREAGRDRRGSIEDTGKQAQEQAPCPFFAAQNLSGANCLLGREVKENTHGELYRAPWEY